jgi:hypothetical protein
MHYYGQNNSLCNVSAQEAIRKWRENYRRYKVWYSVDRASWYIWILLAIITQMWQSAMHCCQRPDSSVFIHQISCEKWLLLPPGKILQFKHVSHSTITWIALSRLNRSFGLAHRSFITSGPSIWWTKCINRAGAHNKVHLSPCGSTDELEYVNWWIIAWTVRTANMHGYYTINMGQPDNLLTTVTFTPLTTIFRLYSGSR